MASTSTTSFPAGLRVLVVDHDRAWIEILEKMLINCNYQVKICNSAHEALYLLENRSDGFDIVFSNVKPQDMDGFMFLNKIKLLTNLPVIMVCDGWEPSCRVIKWIEHGACFCLSKPISSFELRGIWQHVVLKRKYDEQRGVGGKGKRRKDNVDEKMKSESCSSAKKPKMLWTAELREGFVKAVDKIGLDKCRPKKILEVMGVKWLRREHVSSHLQKYRLKKQKEAERGGGAACGCFGISSKQKKTGTACGCYGISSKQKKVESGGAAVFGCFGISSTKDNYSDSSQELHLYNHGVTGMESITAPLMSTPQQSLSFENVGTEGSLRSLMSNDQGYSFAGDSAHFANQQPLVIEDPSPTFASIESFLNVDLAGLEDPFNEFCSMNERLWDKSWDE